MFGITAFSAAPFSALEPLNPNVAKALLGVTASGSLGSFPNPTGVLGTGNIGTLALGTRSIGVTGVSAQGNLGRLIAPLLYVYAQGNIGAVVQGISIALTGAANTGTVGNLGVAERLIGLQGTQAIGVAGNIIPVYWRIIDDSQTPPDPLWVLIDTPPDPLWVLIDTPPDPLWVLIDTPT
jgi:hypothetical protein